MKLNDTERNTMIDHDTHLVGIGAVVSYEDMANPLQLGTVIDICRSEFGTQYRIAFHAQPSEFGPEYGLESRLTWSDLRQHGWKVEG